jgi:5-hydroxyisourate hydrolase-like protein (transthyretin family)
VPHYWRLIAVFATLLARSGSAETIGGRVLEDHSGAPVASADVRVFKVGVREAVADLDTDGDGRFRVSDLAPGEYRLDVSKRNYIGASVRVQAGGDSLSVRLVRRGVISGQIVDQQGQPLAGAYVYAMGKPFASQRAAAYGSVDEQGHYRLYDLPPGQYVVTVAYGASTMALGLHGSAIVRPGVGSGALFYPDNAQPRFFTISGGEEYRNIDLIVTPGALSSVSGKVERASAGVIFWLALTPVDRPALAAAVTQTAPDGSFHFEGVPIGSYSLFVSGPSTGRSSGGTILGPAPLFGRMSLEVSGQPIEGISVRVEPGRSVAFILRALHTAGGDACPETAKVRLTSVDDWAVASEYTAEASTKPSNIDHLAPGRYQIDVEGLGERCYSATSQTLDLAGETDAKPVEVLVTPAGEIRGRLTGAGNPNGYAVVLLRSASDTGDAVQVVVPDGQGRFEFTGLRPGQYRIAAQPAAEGAKARWVGDLAHLVEFQVPGGVPTNVELPAPKENPR